MASKLLPDGRRVLVGSKADPSAPAKSKPTQNQSPSSYRDSAQTAVGSTAPVSEVGVISSKQGLDTVKTAKETEARLTPMKPIVDGKEVDITTTEGQEIAKNAVAERLKDFITYINPETEQEQTLKGNAITDEARKTLEEAGYVVSESNVSSPEVTAAEKELSSYQKEVASYVSKIKGMLVSDNDLRGELASIEAGYDARQKDMEDINLRRQATIKTLGVRTGMRYTGGSGGIIGGIIAEEERQGAMRIADLEAQKMAAMQGAKKAAREYNFTLYTSLMDDAQNKADKKYEEVQKLKETQRLKNEEIVATKAEVERDSLIAEQIGAGVTDPTKIFTALKGKVSFDDILAITKEMPSREDFTLGRYDIRYDADGKVIASGLSAGGGGGVGSGGVGNGLSVGTPTSVIGPPSIGGWVSLMSSHLWTHN